MLGGGAPSLGLRRTLHRNVHHGFGMLWFYWLEIRPGSYQVEGKGQGYSAAPSHEQRGSRCAHMYHIQTSCRQCFEHAADQRYSSNIVCSKFTTSLSFSRACQAPWLANARRFVGLEVKWPSRRVHHTHKHTENLPMRP